MAAAIEDVVKIIERAAPKELACDWDNTGLLIKCSDRVENVLITLDVTQQVVSEAVEKNCDMILSHHPLIFSAIKSISCEDPSGSVVMELIRNGISLYSAHTSFDRAQGGINDALAMRLGLSAIQTVGGDGEDLMRIGELEKRMSAAGFAELVKNITDSECVKISDLSFDGVKRVAVIGGSGGDYAQAAKRQGADVLVTGEAKHNHFVDAKSIGVLLLAAGHYDTEKLFTDVIFSSLQSAIDEVQLHLGLKKAESISAPYSVV